MFHSYVDFLDRNTGIAKLLNLESKSIAGFGSVSSKSFYIAGLFKKQRLPIVWIVSDVSLIKEISSVFSVWSDIPVIGLFDETGLCVKGTWKNTPIPTVTDFGLCPKGFPCYEVAPPVPWQKIWIEAYGAGKVDWEIKCTGCQCPQDTWSLKGTTPIYTFDNLLDRKSVV